MRHWRINLIFGLFFLAYFGVIFRLAHLQIVKYDFYRALAQGQQKFFVELPAERGKILARDKNNNLYTVAIQENWDLVYVSPAEIVNREELAKKLSEILNLDEDWLLEKVQGDSLYQLIKNKITQDEVNIIKELNLKGVYLGKEAGRYYPQEDFLAQVIGFVGGEGKGEYGLESYYNELLAGKEGFREEERGIGGIILSLGDSSRTSKKGSDILLTIDYNIQFMAESLLKSAKETLDIEEGLIIVADPISGKIIALANFPKFNPNQYSKEKDLAIFQEDAVQKLFEPGSVFKPITMAGSLEEGKITPQTIYQDPGIIQIGGYKIYNYDQRSWGQRSMTEVLEKSINTGAVFAKNQLGNEGFLKYIKKFGFFEKTNIDLPAEVFSENKNLKEGYEINFATASFGQGIEITPIQLLRAFIAIANGGKSVKPYLVEKIIEPDGKETINEPQIYSNSVISQKTSSQLVTMLVSVVENGFAKATKIPGYYIAGKTGTAQIPLESQRGYYENKTIQSFVGFAPAYNPKFIILVKLNNPKSKTAEYSAVPIFKELAKYIIDYWEIPPDYE